MSKKILDMMELVIFDMDGTLFDTERLGIECWKAAFNSINYDVPIKLLYNKAGLNSKDSKEYLLSNIDIEFDYNEVKKEKRTLVKKYIDKNGTPIKKGVLDFLDYLDDLGIEKAIATSRGSEMTKYYINKSEISDRFNLIITGDMVSRGKPHPDIFVHVSNSLKIDSDKCLIIEDSINGVIAGKKAGMKTIMIPDLEGTSSKKLEKNGPDIIVQSMDELIELNRKEEEDE